MLQDLNSNLSRRFAALTTNFDTHTVNTLSNYSNDEYI